LPAIQRLLLDGCHDILLPDVVLCEGLLRMRALATVPHAAGVPLTPHTWGDPLGMVANLHLAAAIPNSTYFEFPHDPPSFPASVYTVHLNGSAHGRRRRDSGAAGSRAGGGVARLDLRVENNLATLVS
jgi:hypothetical protein